MPQNKHIMYVSTVDLPNRCVLNGLEVEPIPAELENLDTLSKQRGKAFQAVFRLGTYTGKVPSHNSIKVIYHVLLTSST